MSILGAGPFNRSRLIIFLLLLGLSLCSYALQIQLVSVVQSKNFCFQIGGTGFPEEGEILSTERCRFYPKQFWEISSIDEAVNNFTYIVPIIQADPENPKVLSEDETPQFVSRKLIVRSISGRLTQLWSMEQLPNKNYVITNLGSKACLATGSNGAVTTAVCSGVSTQQWKVIEMEEGQQFEIDMELNPNEHLLPVILRTRYEGRCMERLGTSSWLDLTRCQLRTTQTWYIGTLDVMKSGTNIRNENGGYLTEDTGSAVTVLDQLDVSKNQTWIFEREPYDRNYFHIISAGTGLCLMFDNDIFFVSRCPSSSILGDWSVEEIEAELLSR